MQGPRFWYLRTKILVKIVGMAVKKLRDVVNGVAQMVCAAALDGLAMDVTETWVKKVKVTLAS